MIGFLAITAAVLATASGKEDSDTLFERFRLVRTLEGPLAAYGILWASTPPRGRKKILAQLKLNAQRSRSLVELHERIEEIEAAINAWDLRRSFHPRDPRSEEPSPSLASVICFTDQPVVPGKATGKGPVGVPWFRPTRQEDDLDFVTGLFLPPSRRRTVSGNLLPDLVEVAIADGVQWEVPGETKKDLAHEAAEVGLIDPEDHDFNVAVLRTDSLISADANEALLTAHPKFQIPGGNRAYRRVPIAWLVRHANRAHRVMR